MMESDSLIAQVLLVIRYFAFPPSLLSSPEVLSCVGPVGELNSNKGVSGCGEIWNTRTLSSCFRLLWNQRVSNNLKFIV